MGSPKAVSVHPEVGGGRPDEGCAAPEYACPRCSGAVIRVRRRVVDVLVCVFIPVRRYRCLSRDCSWQGNLRVKRHPLLIRGP